MQKEGFWRTTDKAEVDFVIDKITEIIAVEIKYKSLRKKTVTRSFRSFIDKYNPKTALIVNLELDKEIKIGKTTVRFQPYTKLITENLF